MISKELEKYVEENLPVCSNKIELAYAIYILLGKVLYYSPLYATTKRRETVPKPSEVTLLNPYVICYTWSEIYKALLDKYGIKSYVDNRNKEHSYVILEANGIHITADATKSSACFIYDISNDLTSIKFNLDTNFFMLTPGQKNFQMKKRKYLMMKKRVNKKFDITPDDENIEKYIALLDESELDLEERTILLLNLLNDLYKLNDGEVERRQLFDRYYKKIFKDEEYKNRIISIEYEGYTMPKKLVIVNDGNIKYYLENQNGFHITNRNEIDSLLRCGKIKFKYVSDLMFYDNLTQNNKTLVK